jgi:hypothetical protein
MTSTAANGEWRSIPSFSRAQSGVGESAIIICDDFSPPPQGLGEGQSLHQQPLFRMNENWGFHASQQFEATDGRMEEQFYTLYRDLRSWTAALTFRVRDSHARTG